MIDECEAGNDRRLHHLTPGRTAMRTSEQIQKMKTQPGFIAALDQSGGSTPHALALYGIKDHAWNDDDEMFELVHQMRTRVITSPSFTGKRILRDAESPELPGGVVQETRTGGGGAQFLVAGEHFPARE